MSWLRRWLQRRSDLARGVDADLVRANRKRWKLGVLLFCVALLLGWIAEKLSLPRALHLAVIVLATLLMIASVFLLHWATAEQRFLRKPGPEPPPSIFKD